MHSGTRRAVGASRVAIVRAERGDIDPRFATIRKLAQALGVDPRDLIVADEPPS